MKPLLVIGLGNPLMGDEGIGWHVARRLECDPRLPGSVEAVCGGTDLLRCAGQMEGRDRVVVIDAIQDDSDPGTVTVFDERLVGLDIRHGHAHHLAAAEAIRLLKMTVPASLTLLAVSISGAAAQFELSPAMAAQAPAIVDRVLQELV